MLPVDGLVECVRSDVLKPSLGMAAEPLAGVLGGGEGRDDTHDQECTNKGGGEASIDAL